MQEVLKCVFTFLEGVVRVLGEDARAIAKYCEENKVLSLIVDILEAIGLCLLDAIKIVVTPQGKLSTPWRTSRIPSGT